ncbi:MAG: hypothetical protein RBS17_03830 [Coriobacteriia bacterium]|nr:hypothetical protein [Coriobacteriia bacterium]
MKKTASVLIAVVILVFAFAATAMADTLSGTIAWDPAAPNNAPMTPHKGYAQTTQKCLVCHAVHKASATGQVLLGATVTSACDYCHVTNAGVSTKHVYNNDAANYGSDTPFNHAVSCTACHAVHGANTVNEPAYSSAILRWDENEAQASLPTNWDVTASGTDSAGALSAFCTQCHPYFTGTYADSDTDGDVMGSVNVGGPFNSHIMTSDITSYDPANGANQTGMAAAYASSAYCTSCHDGGSNTVADSFPHLTAGAGFMNSAEFAADTADAALTTTEDGVCLKCHRDTSATTGVGFDF